MKALVRVLALPAYIVAMGFLIYSGVQAHLDASFILKDHTVVEAPTALVDITSRTKRGHTSTMYHFEYSYDVDGETYTAKHSAVNEKGERYLANPVIKIAYSNVEPARSGKLQTLQGQASLWSLIKRLLIVAGVLGLIALLFHGWATSEEDEKTPSSPEQPGAATQS